MNKFKDFIESRKKKGFHFSVSIDIRKVENFFKRLFKKREDKDDEKKRKR